DRPGRDLVALRDQVGELANDRGARLDGFLLALERDDVAAQEDLAGQVALERLEHLVLGPGELGGNLVRKLDLGAHQALSASLTFSETRRPSARPPTEGISAFITLP